MLQRSSVVVQEHASTLSSRWDRFRGFAVRIGAIATVAGMAMLYLMIIGFSSQGGIQLLENEEKISSLRKENEQLELRALELGSLARMNQEAQHLGLVKSDQVVYLPDADSNVAVVE